MMQTMAEKKKAGADFDLRLKRLHYRAWHRGTREMDLLLGSFADHVLPSIDKTQLIVLERLIEYPDDLLHDLLMQDGLLEDKSEQELVTNLRRFHDVAAKK
jgi:antitoxin CptB